MLLQPLVKHLMFFPTCQVRVVRFYQSCSPPPPPPPPRGPDPSGHSRTSTASSRSQWALPDLHRELQIPVGSAGPQPRVADRSGHCRTSTATSRSQWALPPRAPDPSGHCRTSTASCRSQWALPDLNRDFQIAVGTAGPQREEKMSDRMSEDMPERMSERVSEDMSDRMPEDMPDRMPEKMSEDMPDKMSDRMPEDMPDRMPEDLPVRKCINVVVGIIRSEVIFLETGKRPDPLAPLFRSGGPKWKEAAVKILSLEVGRESQRDGGCRLGGWGWLQNSPCLANLTWQWKFHL